PVLVDVHLEWDVGDAADGRDPLEVEPVAAPELQLEPPEPGGALRLPGHLVGIRQADRPRRGRSGPAETEEAPHWKAEELAAEVVEGRVERGHRGPLDPRRRQPCTDLLESERVVAEQL